ncbi:MAG: transcription-repair coupling factor [Betaproteobacteria bacterium]|nr:transcription-repair coupling factor [Betaproteobacteria bacterium]
MITLTPPRPGQRTGVTHIAGSSDACALARLAEKHAPVVVLTATASDGHRLRAEIAFFAPGLRVYLLPDWETLPYDNFSPHQDLVSERLGTLHQISRRECDVAIVPTTTALYRLPPVEYLAAYTFFLKKGERLSSEQLRNQLTLAGYNHVSQVVSPGEYSVRGGIIDLFPMGSVVPYRIDLLDDEIDSIRTFDVDSQKSIYKVNDVRLLPAREFPTDEAARTRFRKNFREKFEGDPSKKRLYKDVSQGVFPAGIEYYLPLFFESSAVLGDYLPQGAVVCSMGNLQEAVETFWRDTWSRYELMRGDPDHPLLPPADLFLLPDQFFGRIKPFSRLEFIAEGEATALPVRALPPLQVERRADQPLHRLAAFIASSSQRVVLLADSLGRRETLLRYLNEYGFKPAPATNLEDALTVDANLVLAVGPLGAGFIDEDAGVAYITENELYPSQTRAKERRDAAANLNAAENLLRDLSELKTGDPVVHSQHGIGRYLGLVNLDMGEGATEFLLLEYDGGDKLYVPVSQLEVIGRYSGVSPESAPLHKLGSGQWEKARKKAAEKVRDTAAELLNLYAQRAARKGHAFQLKPHDYEAFTEGFPFEETRDQSIVIEAVIKDLTAGKPMDRLVCGDVGFGKTEVALRAAFVAVMDGRQVAVLVPTTLLAEQHFQTFGDRFAEWPVKIAELSRFRSGKEQGATLEALREGRIDIVIGTHKLVQDSVKFKNLGLVIIDEEHRFGVRQKEQLKALRAEVDVLALTATPIPRTLAMSLEGIRDFSVIASAPQKRLAIKTFVSRWSDGLIREAVLRELKRGGQVFFVHNEVESIRRMEEKLTALVPEARIRVGHGQLAERELELVMRDFYQQRFNLLLCTTIIETGIDIPSANTIVINRADKFGLAQLHQLRGRVGRSHHQAYSYLLTHAEGNVTPLAAKRLEAIQMMEELGSGFFLAMHDLEIRGAGEVLGESQSGEMQEVGFALYAEMLKSAVRSLKQGKEPDLSQPLSVSTEIKLHAPALLPEDYCPGVHERLVLYKRMANCESAEALEELQEEITDRFGLPPGAARTLMDSHRLRIAAKSVGVIKIDASTEAIQLQFERNPPIDPARIIQLIQTRRNFRLSGQDKLRVDEKHLLPADRVARTLELFRELKQPVARQPAR